MFGKKKQDVEEFESQGQPSRRHRCIQSEGRQYAARLCFAVQ